MQEPFSPTFGFRFQFREFTLRSAAQLERSACMESVDKPFENVWHTQDVIIAAIQHNGGDTSDCDAGASLYKVTHI